MNSHFKDPVPASAGNEPDLARAKRILADLIAPEKGFIRVAMVYGIAIALLTLSLPIAVQTLINTVANIASTRAILILSAVLFLTLLLSGLLTALRTKVMELYERHVYARLTSRLSLITLLAPHSVFEGRRNTTLTHRYFDIMTLQKNIPALVVDGFALLLQLVVGFALVSFYHPMLFALNVLIIGLIYVIWLVWGRGAKVTAIKLSQAKYDSAKWLSSLITAHEFFQSARHLDHAGRSTEEKIAQYVDCHRSHFRYTFSQVLSFLALYALASAVLLGLGGWLVIRGELSIGQLVAAELIMSAVFFGLTQFTNYLKLYYELYGAADKLGQILELPQEEISDKDDLLTPTNGTLQCRNLELSHLGNRIQLDFTIEAGAKVFASCDELWMQRALTKVLKNHIKPGSGWIRLGGRELSEYDIYGLRHDIVFVDRSLIIDCSIKDYLRLAAPDTSTAGITDVLEQVGLSAAIESLPQGIDTLISSMGAPLLPADVLLLKLASAILAKPKLVVLNQDIDNMPRSLRSHLLNTIQQQDFSVIYFTDKPEAGVFNGLLHCDSTSSANASSGLVISPSDRFAKVSA
jgi:ABC-type bacteriocin/lantibiotic exporter with double-glycine peptidase domain